MIMPDNEYSVDRNPDTYTKQTDVFDSKGWQEDMRVDIKYGQHLQALIIELVKLHYNLKTDHAKITQWDSIAALGRILSYADDGEK
jgi:major membrane immunogen (membrane-anchored lipoprotein)